MNIKIVLQLNTRSSTSNVVLVFSHFGLLIRDSIRAKVSERLKISNSIHQRKYGIFSILISNTDCFENHLVSLWKC